MCNIADDTYWHDLEWFEWTLIEKLRDIWPMCAAVKNGEYHAFLPKLHKDQINVWFGSHCFELSSSPLLRVWLAFVSAMIVCYLKPKLRARVVSLLVTILVTAMRSIVCSYCDTAFFPAQCACNRFFLPMFRLSSNHQVFFVGIFHFSNIIIFFIVLVICTCFTARMASSLLINDFFVIHRHARAHHFNKWTFFMNATFLFIGLCQLSDAFLKSQLNYINQWTFIFCFLCFVYNQFSFFNRLPFDSNGLYIFQCIQKKYIINQNMFAFINIDVTGSFLEINFVHFNFLFLLVWKSVHEYKLIPDFISILRAWSS